MRVAECEVLRARVRELVAENNALRGIAELSGQRNRRNGVNRQPMVTPYRHPKMTPLERPGSWPDAV